MQLPNYMARKDQPGESNWAALREAQLMTLKKVPNTGMAVAIDIGEANNIHPTNKQEEGCNLYNKDGLPASPFCTEEW